MKNTRLKEFLSVISIIFLSAIVSCKPSDNVSKLDVPGGSDNQTEITIPVAPGDDGYKFVDIENGSATGDGSMVDPVNSITLGIQIANASNSDVCVAQGVYNVDSSASTEIIMKEGVSIFGSYKNVNGNWTRDASAETVLQDKADKGGSRTQPLRVILCNSDITNDTVIDGFTIIGARAGKASTAIFCNGGSPIISNNKIDAGGKLNNIELVSGVY